MGAPEQQIVEFRMRPADTGFMRVEIAGPMLFSSFLPGRGGRDRERGRRGNPVDLLADVQLVAVVGSASPQVGGRSIDPAQKVLRGEQVIEHENLPENLSDNFPCGWEPHANQVTARWGEGWRELS